MGGVSKARRPLPLGLWGGLETIRVDSGAPASSGRGAPRRCQHQDTALANGIAAKKATHAIVCETIKHILLKLVIRDAGVRSPQTYSTNDRRRRRRRDEDDEDEDDEDEDDDDEDDVAGGCDDEDEGGSSGGGDDDDDGTTVQTSMGYVLGYEMLFGAASITAAAIPSATLSPLVVCRSAERSPVAQTHASRR